MTQVPMAMRETSSEVPGIPANGMLKSRYFGLLPTIHLFLSSAIIGNAGYPLIATPARTVSGATRGESRRELPARDGLRRGHERRRRLHRAGSMDTRTSSRRTK